MRPHAIRYINMGKIITKTQNIFPDMCQACGQGDGSKSGTSKKNTVPDICQAVGKGDGIKFVTKHKSIVPNMCQA